MLNTAFKNMLRMPLKNSRSFFSTHQQPIPNKLPKVQSVLINLYVKNRYGVVEKVPAFVGESILEAITRMNVHAYDRDELCNGYDYTYRPHYRPHDNDTKGPICGSCRIVLEGNWFQRVHQETDGYNVNEQPLLHLASLDLKSKSRLACCVPVEAWMQGLTCSVDIDPIEEEESIII